jgi:5-methylcytosine-specific restriction endonuclease McrA
MQRKSSGKSRDNDRLERVVADAQRARLQREQGYREQSLKIHPWVCGRCGRHFTRENLHELTVHHKDHNHDNNPSDGSNWENLCLYCHDNEHARHADLVRGAGYELTGKTQRKAATHQPFADLKSLLTQKRD